jgi:hexulose-6-phosphate isomerase
MQGRLSRPSGGRIQCFPTGTWETEFAAASEAGLDFIEWIFDAAGNEVNPLLQRGGPERIARLAADYGVVVPSVCADWFMDHPLLRGESGERRLRLETLLAVIEAGSSLAVRYVVLPFVDASRLESADEVDAFVTLMDREVLPAADAAGVEIHLETSLPPDDVRAVLGRIANPMFFINYDSGNSASLGYRVDEEFAAYGSRIGSIHIKDRVLGAGTVPLGTGDVDFVALRRCVADIRYQRNFVLQVARDADGDEIEAARRNIRFVRDHVL